MLGKYSKKITLSTWSPVSTFCFDTKISSCHQKSPIYLKFRTQKNKWLWKSFARILLEFLPEKLKNIRINTIFQLFPSTLFTEIDKNEILRNSVDFLKFWSATSNFDLNWDSRKIWTKICLLLLLSKDILINTFFQNDSF